MNLSRIPQRGRPPRANLAQFDDVGKIVDAWRAGNLSWDYAGWGPDPDSADCLLSDM
jgi:hypothetical protein